MEKIGIFLRMLVSILTRGPSRLTLAGNYLDAWNAHNVDRVLELTGGGSYQDPLTGGAVSGDALREHAKMLLKALPDLRFELDGPITAGEGTVAARYVLHATHTGDLPGQIGFDAVAATGKRIALPGTIFFNFDAEGHPAVSNLFDQVAFGEALGFQGFLLPQQMGDYSFGAFYRLNRGSMEAPNAIGLTWIRMEDGQKGFDHVATITRDVLEHLSTQNGFVTGMVGARKPDENGHSYGFTISAWEELENMDQILASPTHQGVVHEFMKEKVAYATHSRVYQLVRTKPLMIACRDCGKKNNAHNKTGKCSACTAPLGDPPPYW